MAGPEQIAKSRFWTSDWQAKIKRAEAFVRIWRHALALAGLTLKDLVDITDDILGGEGARKKALAALRADPSKQAHFDQKRTVLFGEGVRKEEGKKPSLLDVVDRCDLASGLIDGAAKLRHAVFHFKGREYFLDELAELPKRFPANVGAAAQQLWQSDVTGRAARLNADLVAVHVPLFLTQEQAAQVFALLAADTIAEVPLPRFSRLLERARPWVEDKDAGVRLPEPANRRDLEDPARLCQYTLIKCIYERPFRAWLARQPAAAIAGWYDRAVARSSAAAKQENAKGDAVAERVITARAAALPKPAKDGDVVTFLFDLSRATASEMRVQRGYESDPDKARAQAEFIDRLLRDVVILALSAYLTKEKLGWVLDLKPGQIPAEPPLSSLDDVKAPEAAGEAEKWPAALYLLLHLLPVEAVGQLLHQLFRWNTAATRETDLPEPEERRRQRLEAAMTLYLDMHDAKFEGGSPLQQYEAFRGLFASGRGFERVFPRVSDQKAEQRIPKRGLREIMRFGRLALVKAICRDSTIDDGTVGAVMANEDSEGKDKSKIAALQERREELHEKWVKQKRLDKDDLRDYCATLNAIAQHRHAANFVYLVDHVRAHRAIMAVLGRLVDYAGLFERDLYFVTLALLHQNSLRPQEFFNTKGLEDVRNGEIISALHERKGDAPQAAGVEQKLARHFTKIWGPKNRIRGIRNDLMHLNMLQASPPTPRLTHWINEARELMAYDRKLKNAVSKSIIELLAREGLAARWTIRTSGGAHDLADGILSSRCAEHLGGMKLKLRGADRRDKGQPIAERLHSDAFVGMVAAAFDGKPVKADSILDSLSTVNWEASVHTKRHGDRGGPSRPHSPREKLRPGQRRRDREGRSGAKPDVRAK